LAAPGTSPARSTTADGCPIRPTRAGGEESRDSPGDDPKGHTVTTETCETIRLTADVIIVTPDRHVLLIERGHDPYEGHWALPGGHVDVGEASIDAAVRELREETGVHLTADNLSQLGTWDTPGRDPRGRYVTVAYLAAVPTGTSVIAGDDARTARWWPLDALPEQIAFDHADILRIAAAR
jgi:8-oxo-dGTP diphosphatase